MEIELENLSKQELLALIKEQSKTISIQQKSISTQEKVFLKQEKLIAKKEKSSVKIEGELEKQKQKIAELEYLVDLLRRMKFGQSRERFEDPNQTKLPLEVQAEVLQEQEEIIKQEITYSRAKKKHPGRARLRTWLF